jgi:hypothetical protein
MVGKLELVPIQFAEASEFVRRHHRHHIPPVGHKYSIAASAKGSIIGVAIVGRPVSRALDDGFTLEVTRLCTNGHKNACSFLYAAAWRVAKNLGYRRIVTYIQASESGTSLTAAGWKPLYQVRARSWSTPKRPRVDKHSIQSRLLFEAV